jgi:hypothetical protein
MDGGSRTQHFMTSIFKYSATTSTIQEQTILFYSLRPIILFANIDVSRHILVIDISVLAKSNMGRRE